MRWKKVFCGVAAASLIFSASNFCSAAAEDSANAKLAKIEIDTYGAEQRGALLDRIAQLEKSYSGQNMTGNMNARIEAIYDILYDNSAEPGILAKVNVLEWNLNHEVVIGGIDTRLVTLENQIFGKTLSGTFNERIRELAKASYGAEILPIAQVQIPANVLIKVVTTAPVSSKFMQEGDIIPVKIIEDVFVDDSLVFARGLPGEGVVTRVLRAKNIFSNGKIETDFNLLKSLDGQDVKTFIGIEAQDEMLANSMGRGLSLIGQTFSGKNKDIEEVFIRGKNIELPAGIELYVQIKEPTIVYGLRKSGGYVAPIVEKPTVETPFVETPGTEVIVEPTPTPSNSYPGLDPEEFDLKPTENVEPKPTENVEPKPTENVEPPRDDINNGEIIEIIDEE